MLGVPAERILRTENAHYRPGGKTVLHDLRISRFREQRCCNSRIVGSRSLHDPGVCFFYCIWGSF